MARTRQSGGGFGKVLLGFMLGAIVAGGAGFAYFEYRRKPVSMVDKPMLVKKRPPSPAPKPNIEIEPKKPPFGISEEVFEAGARIYKARCANCHGTPDHTAVLDGKLDPPPSQLLRHGRTSRASGVIYDQVANGIPGSGMPGYRHVLPDTALWEVSLLLANAGKPLPDPVTRILREP